MVTMTTESWASQLLVKKSGGRVQAVVVVTQMPLLTELGWAVTRTRAPTGMVIPSTSCSPAGAPEPPAVTAEVAT